MPKSVGRPRDEAIDARVLSATARLMLERGYAELRIDDVVTASGVAKTTIYRRWPSLAHLAVGAMAALLGEREIVRSGDVEADLRAIALAALRSLQRSGPGLAALALDLHRQNDPELHDRYRSALVDPVRQTMIDIVRDGQRTGAFRAAADAEAATDALMGAAFYRLTVLRAGLTDADLEAALDVVLTGLRPR